MSVIIYQEVGTAPSFSTWPYYNSIIVANNSIESHHSFNLRDIRKKETRSMLCNSGSTYLGVKFRTRTNYDSYKLRRIVRISIARDPVKALSPE